jgi:hypothetical protein
MKIKPTLPVSNVARFALSLTALIGFAPAAFTLGQSAAGPATSGTSIKGQQGEPAKFLEPDVLGVVFYLDFSAHTITALPKEKWIAVGKSKPGFASVSAIGSLQLSGISSSFRVPASDTSEFVFKTADPDHVKLYMCSQDKKKGFRRADVIAIKNTGVFQKTSTRTSIDSVDVEIAKYGESSYKLTAKSLAPGEYVILFGDEAFTFGVL